MTTFPSRTPRLLPMADRYSPQDAGKIARYRIEGTNLEPSESPNRISKLGLSINVSPDSKYVCFPASSNNAGNAFSIDIYSVDDLAKKQFTLISGPFPKRVGFDPVGKFVFTHKFDKQLIIYSMTGAKLKEYAFENARGRSRDPLQFVAHPHGSKLLVVFEQEYHFVEIEDLKQSRRSFKLQMAIKIKNQISKSRLRC